MVTTILADLFFSLKRIYVILPESMHVEYHKGTARVSRLAGNLGYRMRPIRRIQLRSDIHGIASKAEVRLTRQCAIGERRLVRRQ